MGENLNPTTTTTTRIVKRLPVELTEGEVLRIVRGNKDIQRTVPNGKVAKGFIMVHVVLEDE